MKRRFNETIDGSIKNIIQLKTVNNSLEWSQMYDALEDCPVEFINKLIQTLNSLGETMGVDPAQTFDKVLCNVNDDSEETRKKLYNWWRGVFEVLGSCKNSIPKDREEEFNEKVDALMAEILKSGDGQNTAEEEPEEDEEGAEGQVMLEEEYEPADKEDETNMLTDMKWAVGKIGEIANRVQELINFVNPYCEVNESMMNNKPARYSIGDHVLYKGEEYVVTDIEEDLRNDEEIYQVSRDSDKVHGLSFNEWATSEELELIGSVNESADQPKFKVGDVVRMMNVSGMDFYGRDAPIGPIVKIQPPHPDVGVYEYMIKGRSGEFFAYEDELELMNGFEKEDKSNMKKKTIWKEIRQTSQDDWVDAGEVFEMANESMCTDLSLIDWDGPAIIKIFDPDNERDGFYAGDGVCDWNIQHAVEFDSPAAAAEKIKELGDDGTMFIWSAHMKEDRLDESDLENELDKGDDGWVEIGQPVGESKPVELESGATKKVSLYVDWDDDGAGIDKNVVIDVPAEIADSEESTALYDYITDWIDHQDFCVNDWAITDIEGLDNEVELEGTDWKDITEKLDAVELADSIDGWEDSSKNLVVASAYEESDDAVVVNVCTTIDDKKKIADMVEKYLLGNVENWQIDSVSESKEGEDGKFYTEVRLKPKYEEVAENNDEVKSADVKDGEKQVTQDGETKTLVAGEENKKPVCEMTIEQEIDNPWKLSELLWSQGKENLEELLRSELVGEEEIMQMLEDMGVRNLTNINDLFAFDFPSVLDSLGLDPEAWSQNLEFVKRA